MSNLGAKWFAVIVNVYFKVARVERVDQGNRAWYAWPRKLEVDAVLIEARRFVVAPLQHLPLRVRE